MDDVHDILTSRLDALGNNLDVVSANLNSKAWQSRSSTRSELLGESSLWVGLEATLVKEIRKYQAELTSVKKDLAQAAPDDLAAVSAAWKRYTKTLRDSQGLLRECLEIIGTLAIRDKDLDQKILHIADELIRDCLTLSTGGLDYYLLIHGLEETFSKARARIIRLRFPDWTLWDLPLAAHELGHVVIAAIQAGELSEDDASERMLTVFLKDQRDLLLARVADLITKHGAGGAEEAERWAHGRVRVLLADAFATYIMGPAYACSAIMLRLSPAVGAQRDLPSDSQRAHVVMSMLRWMNAEAPIPKPYTDVIERLGRMWETTLDGSNPDSRLDAAEQEHLKQLTDVFGSRVCRSSLITTAMYPYHAQADGWRRAQEWSSGWLEEWNNNMPLSTPANSGGKLRDVLNATWLCRLGIKDDKHRAHRDLAHAGQDLCRAIIAARTTGGLIPPSSAPNAGGRQ